MKYSIHYYYYEIWHRLVLLSLSPPLHSNNQDEQHE